MRILATILFLMASIVGYLSQTGEDAKRLRTKLFVTDEYDRKIIPSANQSDPKEVFVDFFLLSINGLSEVSETLTTTGYLWVTWTDDYLTWEPSDFGGIQIYHWPQNDVWRPDIALKNSVLDYQELGAYSLNVEVESIGNVHWFPFQVFHSTCHVDTTNFPFDSQTCHLIFVAWSYSKAQVTMVGGSRGINLEQYVENPLWTILDSDWSSELYEGEAAIKFTIKMKRKPLHVLLSIIMPIVMLAVLNVFVFILPCESGERSGYAVTVFLSLAVFLTIVSTTLPASSDTVAIFSIYVMIQTLQSTTITVMALITIRLTTKETEVPPCLVRLVYFTQSLSCKVGGPRGKPKVEPYVAKLKGTVKDIVLLQAHDKTIRNGQEKGVYVREIPVQEKSALPETLTEISWPAAVRAIDVILFIVHCVSVVFSTAVCFYIVATSD